MNRFKSINSVKLIGIQVGYLKSVYLRILCRWIGSFAEIAIHAEWLKSGAHYYLTHAYILHIETVGLMTVFSQFSAVSNTDFVIRGRVVKDDE